MTTMLSMLALLPAVALAETPTCEPLPEAEFVDRIHASLDAIDRDDVAGHKAVIVDLEARIPCMEFVPDPRAWSELLVGIAIVNYATDKSWESYLTTAAWAEPRALLDLPVGPSHPFWTWVPEPAPEPTDQQVPDGVRLYMDGLLIEKVPVVMGIHLLQRRTGDGWENLLLVDEGIPERWLREPSLLQQRKALTEYVLGLGPNASYTRMAAMDERDYLAGARSLGAGAALYADGRVAIGIPLGVQGRLWLPALGPLRGGALDLGFFWRAGPVDLRVGAGIRGLEAVDAARRNALGAGAHLGADLHLEATRLGFTGAVGGSFLALDGTLTQPVGRWVAGVFAGYTRSRWQHQGTVDPVDASLYTAGVLFGFGGGAP